MILIVGGRASGKRSFAKDVLGFCDRDISSALADGTPVICDVQDLLRQSSRQELLPLLLEKQAVICNEVGCGIVPVDKEDRLWREEVGRMCCDLAQEATAVVRMCCGLPSVLKGEL